MQRPVHIICIASHYEIAAQGGYYMDNEETQDAIRQISEGVAQVEPDWVEQTFLLPFPPSANNLFVNNRKTGGRFVAPRYAAWRTEAGWALKAQNPQKTTGSVHVNIIAIKPDRAKRDIDNIAKAINDLLVEHGVVEDDSLIERQVAAWSSSNLQGVSVTVVGAIKKRA